MIYPQVQFPYIAICYGWGVEPVIAIVGKIPLMTPGLSLRIAPYIIIIAN